MTDLHITDGKTKKKTRDMNPTPPQTERQTGKCREIQSGKHTKDGREIERTKQAHASKQTTKGKRRMLNKQTSKQTNVSTNTGEQANNS